MRTAFFCIFVILLVAGCTEVAQSPTQPSSENPPSNFLSRSPNGLDLRFEAVARSPHGYIALVEVTTVEHHNRIRVRDCDFAECIEEQQAGVRYAFEARQHYFGTPPSFLVELGGCVRAIGTEAAVIAEEQACLEPPKESIPIHTLALVAAAGSISGLTTPGAIVDVLLPMQEDVFIYGERAYSRNEIEALILTGIQAASAPRPTNETGINSDNRDGGVSVDAG
jgi:hypothetical protein